MAETTVVWNRVTTDTSVPSTVMGMSGWRTVPRHWYGRPVAGGSNQWEVCENENFTGRLFISCLADDGITMVYQDLYANRMEGNDR